MSKLSTGLNLIKTPQKIVRPLCNNGLLNWMSDEAVTKWVFCSVFGYKLNLKNPQTFNEKLQWLKLYNHKPEYTTIVDKYKVREYIRQELGDEYLIPLLGVWDSVEEIDLDALPNRFVLKCNHDQGSVVICRDKAHFDWDSAKKKLARKMRKDHYAPTREWVYKDIPRKILCEQYMEDAENADSLTDYKFFCFDGYADCVMVCLDRFSDDKKFYFFDQKWELKRLNTRGKNAPEGFTIPKPTCMDEMFRIAEKLSKGLPFARVDLYECNGKVYFGEITFFPDGGFDANLLPETDRYFGSLIDLSPVKQTTAK